MIKYSILFLFLATIVLLGLTTPPNLFLGPRRDPVPDTQKVAHSSHCAGCHGYDQSGLALVDNAGNDVNIHDDWQVSMMGLSAHDPFWRATLSHETNIYSAAKNEIENTCLKCHAPLGKIQSHLSGLPYSFELMLQDSLGLDGVSCSSCHQQPSKRLGSGHSGNFHIDTNRILYGPYPNPVEGPMQIYVGFEPVFAEHIYSSGICAGCHTLITETLDETGTPTGNFFVEQATYHEWLNSVYPAQGKECQTCHMPFIQDSVVIATDLLALEKRYPYGLHQFFGANTAMLTLMELNMDILDLPAAPASAWNESIENNRKSLEKASTMEISSMQVLNDTLYVDLIIKNKSGHKLPSGYPSRVAWIEVVLSKINSADTIYQNGVLTQSGMIRNRDLPFEPHYEISRSQEEVQIYEMVMADMHGSLTTRLNGAHHPLKDNRLLPVGFKRSHATYDTVAIWGNANTDPQYDVQSHLGLDEIQYRIPLDGNKGFADLRIKFNYHTFPARWMEDLFASDSLPYVANFKSMYEGFEDFAEVMDELEVKHVSLSASSIKNEKEVNVHVYPNPGNGKVMYLEFDNTLLKGSTYILSDLTGKTISSGKLDKVITLPDAMQQGIYYFIIYKDGNIISVEPITRS